jgi:DNA-binding NarL/FixJ family response regulator
MSSVRRVEGFQERSDPRVVGLAPRTKSLVLIDGLRFTRECLADLLESELPQYQIISIASLDSSCEQLSLGPDVVLLNAHLAPIGDAALTSDMAAICRIAPDAPLLVLTDNSELTSSLTAEAPPAGIFPFECGFPLLVAAIGLVAAGGQFYAPNAPPKRSIARRREASPYYSM